ncbi:unnamed protein product [Urochloa humidicola]
MDEEKPNPPVGPERQSKEEAVVHHPVAMDVQEDAADSNTQELVSTPNSNEEAIAHDAAAAADIVEAGTQDATMQEDEEYAQWRAFHQRMDEEERRILGFPPPPELTLEEWLYNVRRELPCNNNNNAAAAAADPEPDAAAEEEEEEDDQESEEEHEQHMDDNDVVATLTQMRNGVGPHRRAPRFGTRMYSDQLIRLRMGALAGRRANSAMQRWRLGAPDDPPAYSLERWMLGAPDIPPAYSPMERWTLGAPDNPPAYSPMQRWRVGAPDNPPAYSPMQAPSTGAGAAPFAGAEREGANNNSFEEAMPTAPANDPGSSTMQSLIASENSRAVFPGMGDEEDNGWYDSIARDAHMEEMEEEDEDPGLDGTTMPSPLRLPISMAPKEVPGDNHHSPTAAEEEKEDSPAPELSLKDISNNAWGLAPSQLGPDEAGPSTRTIKKPRVLPLADDEVPKFDCGICMETLPIFDLFHGMPCPHRFCAPCMGKYIESKIRAGEVPVPCPEPACKEEAEEGGGILDPEDCKKSIDYAVFISWSDQLTERAIAPGHRVYCPNRKCGVMLEKSTCGGGGKAPVEVRCPACRRMMCAACGLEWSTDGSGQHDCVEGAEAMLVKGLAAERQWKQCPRCRMLVERTIGCDTMTCRY